MLYNDNEEVLCLKTLYEIIKNRRIELDISIRKASKLTGVSTSYLSNLEKGRDPRSGKYIKPTPETLEMISKGYNLDYNDLLVAAGVLKDDNEDVNSLTIEGFRDDLLKNLQNEGFYDESMSKDETDKLIKKIIHTLEIFKSN